MSDEVLQLTDDNFEGEVLRFPDPVLVHFSASWCHDSKGVTVMMREIASIFGSFARIGELDADENPLVTREWKISSLPTVILFSRGQEKQRFMGLTKDVLEHALTCVVGDDG